MKALLSKSYYWIGHFCFLIGFWRGYQKFMEWSLQLDTKKVIWSISDDLNKAFYNTNSESPKDFTNAIDEFKKGKSVDLDLAINCPFPSVEILDNCIYITFNDNPIIKTLPIKPKNGQSKNIINVDYDKNNNIVGVEVINFCDLV